jgi:hypothetical protein
VFHLKHILTTKHKSHYAQKEETGASAELVQKYSIAATDGAA